MRMSISIAILILVFSFINIFVGASDDGANSIGAKIYPVQVETVKYLDSHIIKHEFTGHVVAGRRSNLGFELGGRIDHVFKDNGDRVLKGEAIATLDMSRTKARLRSLRAQEQEIAARLLLAERSLARRKETYNDSHTSAQVLDEAIANETAIKAQLDRIRADVDLMDVDLGASTLKAPFDAFVDRRLLDEGVIVTSGMPIVTVIEQGNYEAQVGIPNEYISLVTIGDVVELRSEEGQDLSAEVLRISPAIRGETRTQLVTLKLNDLSLISFGQLITLKLDNERASRGFWVPITALTADVRGLWRLFKLGYNDDTHLEAPRIVVENVQILHVDEAMAFVSGSINDGDQFVSVGVAKLTPNQLVRPVVE